MKKSEMLIVSKTIASMLRNKQQVADDGVLMLFDLALREHDFEEVMKALKKLITQGVIFALEPHHVIEAMGPSNDELNLESAEQWANLLNAVRFESSPKFHNPITAYLAANEFNIWSLKEGSEESMSRMQGKFIKAYLSASKNQEIKNNIMSKAQSLSLLSGKTKAMIADANPLKLEARRGQGSTTLKNIIDIALMNNQVDSRAQKGAV